MAGILVPAVAPGLVLVKSQTIGSGVSSVTISNAFSTNYENYRIILSNGVASGNCELNLTLGSTATGYYQIRYSTAEGDSSVTVVNQADNTSFAGAALGSVNSLNAFIDISSPFATKYTSLYSLTQRTATQRRSYVVFGHLQNTTSYTAFTLTTTDAATLTGGTIKVYGYANS